MLQSGSAVTGLSPADSYPSPPTSPKSARVADESASIKNITKTESESPTDPGTLTKLPVKPGERARPVTPAESTASDDDETEAAKEEVSELKKWKEALSLSNMRCGATRKDNNSCDNKISDKKMKSMDDIIKLLWIQSNSSLEVETHLDSLAKLAHCHYHDHPPARESRVNEWMAVLPGAPRALSLQRRLRNIIGSAPTKCTSIKKDGKPCRNVIGRERRFYCEKTASKMIQMVLDPKEEDEPLPLLAKVLQHHILCHVHQVQPYKHQDEWMRRINKFHAACQNEVNTKNGETQAQKAATGGGAEKKAVESKLASPDPTLNTKELVENPGAYWDAGYETSPFDILGRCDIADEGKSTVDEIRDTAQELLNTDNDKSENEVNDGFVYLYKVPGNDELVKIGFTTGNVAARLNKWRKDCHREPAHLYPPDSAAACKAVPHAHRVERLVHAELMECRVRLYCERCGKQHIEWFETPVEDAIAVIEKWSLWIRGCPYEQRETRNGIKWYLKEAEAKRLADVPKFLKELQSAVEAAKII